MAQTNRFLKPCEILAILNELARDGETGTLVLQRESVTKFLYLQEGQVIFAASNAPEDKFTQILIEKGRLTSDQVALATEKKGNRTIGRTLVDLGFLSSEDLLDSLVSQVKKISISVALWPSGTASFKSNILPPGVAKLPITTNRLILDTAASIDDRALVGSALGGLEAIFDISESSRETARSIQLTPQEAAILDLIDGRRSIQEACDQVGVDVFFGARFVLGLLYLKLVERRGEGRGEVESQQAKVDLSFLDDVVPISPVIPTTPAEPPPSFPDEPERDAAFQPQLFESGGESAPEPEAPAFDSEEILEDQYQEKQADEPFVSPLADTEGPGSGEGAKTGVKSPRIVYPETVENRWRLYKKLVLYFTLFLIVGVTWAIWWIFAPQTGSFKEPPKTALTQKPSQAMKVPTPQAAGKPAVQSPPKAASNEPALPAPPVTAPQKNQPAATPPQPAPPATKPAPAQPQAAPKPSNMPAPAPQPPTKPPVAAPAQPTAKDPPKQSPAKPSPPRELLASGKYREAARAFQQESGSHRGSYTIFLEIACQDETISKACQASAGRTELVILPQTFSGKSCYKVIWGSYRTRQEAEAAMKNLPPHFRDAPSPPRVGPWPTP